jgi:hypothetical protein
MHHSVELKDVVAILFQKLKELDLVFDGGAAIHLFTEGSKMQLYGSFHHLTDPVCVNLPYDEDAFKIIQSYRMYGMRKKLASIYSIYITPSKKKTGTSIMYSSIMILKHYLDMQGNLYFRQRVIQLLSLPKKTQCLVPTVGRDSNFQTRILKY